MPIGRENWRETVLPRAKEMQRELAAAGIRVTLDERDERPGWKFSEWELRGVPLRLEIGPKDIEKSQVLIARRDTREKIGVPMDGLTARLRELLDDVQRNAARRAPSRSATSTRSARTPTTRSSRRWKGVPASSSRPWCGSADCEAQIKTDTQATIRNMPLDGPPAEGACVRCDAPAHARSLVREVVLDGERRSGRPASAGQAGR